MGTKDKLGYSDGSPYSNEPFIDINTPSGIIDMSNTGRTILANGKELPPYSGLHDMGTTTVREIPLDKFQGPLRLGETGTKLGSLFTPIKNYWNYNILGKTNPNLLPISTKSNFTPRIYNFEDWQKYIADVSFP